MSQPLFDPLDVAVLTRRFVPWAAGVLAQEAADQREELVHRTMDVEPWIWTGFPKAAELSAAVDEPCRPDRVAAVLGCLAHLRAAVNKALPLHGGLARGEHA